LEEKQISEKIEKFITFNISKIVINNELETILSNSSKNNIDLQVFRENREIVSNYEKDDVQLDITILIPESYPLKLLSFSSKKKKFVGEYQYRFVFHFILGNGFYK
jgi:hypothetical protein